MTKKDGKSILWIIWCTEHSNEESLNEIPSPVQQNTHKTFSEQEAKLAV